MHWDYNYALALCVNAEKEIYLWDFFLVIMHSSDWKRLGTSKCSLVSSPIATYWGVCS